MVPSFLLQKKVLKISPVQKSLVLLPYHQTKPVMLTEMAFHYARAFLQLKGLQKRGYSISKGKSKTKLVNIDHKTKTLFLSPEVAQRVTEEYALDVIIEETNKAYEKAKHIKVPKYERPSF